MADATVYVINIIMKDYKNSLEDFSHDLKTPLTVMKCNLELLSMDIERGKKDLKLQKFIKLMETQIERMNRILTKGPVSK